MFASLVQDAKAFWVSEAGKNIQFTASRIVAKINAIADSKNLDAMIELEIGLQEIDHRDAQTELGKNSAKKAANDYKQIKTVMSQMRRSPMEYVLSNASMQPDGTKQSPHRGPNQIRANIARLQNRNNFPSPGYKTIWDARIELAKATQRELAKLHAATIERCPAVLDDEVIDEQCGRVN